MGANPHANGGKLTQGSRTSRLPSLCCSGRQRTAGESTRIRRPSGAWLRDIFTDNAQATISGSSARMRRTRTDWMMSLRCENRCFVGQTLAIDDHMSADGRVMEVLSEHLCEGWLEGYTLTGRHGLYVTYEAFAMVSASMTVQHTKWLEESLRPAVARASAIPQRAADVDMLAQRPQRLQPSGAGPDRCDALQAGRSPASICLPTRTACSRWPITACGAAAM